MRTAASVRRAALAAALVALALAAPGVRSAPSVAAARGPAALPAQAAPAGRGPEAFTFATARYESGNWDSAPLVPTNILHSVAQYTAIPVASQGVLVDLSSPEIFRFPYLFLTGHLPLRFNPQENANLKAYVERGGLLHVEDHSHDVDGGFHKTAVAELRRIFGANALRPIPNTHELYRSFFLFPDGPPTTSHELNGWGDGLVHENLLGVEVNGRLGVLYSNKDYASEWNYHARNKRFQSVDNTRFGVNIVVYALTR
ncbi:MAG TPA: DUF4159 domain-containing protein [Longimicrobium sp.]|jgi:hypothetical protein|uniref:DUF4159 domain-containing protein n=1 Tax=Longimicrobium sp. TaxID=2029185 RepID=UPI002ED9D747